MWSHRSRSQTSAAPATRFAAACALCPPVSGSARRLTGTPANAASAATTWFSALTTYARRPSFSKKSLTPCASSLPAVPNISRYSEKLVTRTGWPSGPPPVAPTNAAVDVSTGGISGA